MLKKGVKLCPLGYAFDITLEIENTGLHENTIFYATLTPLPLPQLLLHGDIVQLKSKWNGKGCNIMSHIFQD